MNKFLLDNSVTLFSREFATLKAMSQYVRRNPALKATPYVWHENSWQRFAILGNQVLPVNLLHSLLNSLQTTNSLNQNEAPDASPTSQLFDSSLN